MKTVFWGKSSKGEWRLKSDSPLTPGELVTLIRKGKSSKVMRVGEHCETRDGHFYYTIGSGKSKTPAPGARYEPQVGDRVKVTCATGFCGKRDVIGKLGTVRKLMGREVGVEFDEEFDGGHDLGGLCENGYGRWGKPEELTKVDTPAPDKKDDAPDGGGVVEKVVYPANRVNYTGTVKSPDPLSLGEIVTLREDGKGTLIEIAEFVAVDEGWHYYQWRKLTPEELKAYKAPHRDNEPGGAGTKGKGGAKDKDDKEKDDKEKDDKEKDDKEKDGKDGGDGPNKCADCGLELLPGTKCIVVLNEGMMTFFCVPCFKTAAMLVP